MPRRVKQGEFAPAQAAPAAPDPASAFPDPVNLFAMRCERNLLVARSAALAAAERLWRLPANAPIEELIAAADAVTAASGALWMHACRVQEARSAGPTP